MLDQLDCLHQKIERQFKSLRNIRKNSELPVFAMEHGLSKLELKQLKCDLPLHYKLRSLRSSDWLLWVVYATEVGYDYTGEEYWGSFEKRIPGWEYKERYKIKAWFRKFQSTYDGVIPYGRWAEHFTIITWPITHAILPVYLQRQFAKSLYDLRYRLLNITILEPASIGRLLAANVHMPASRFQMFLEQEELIGRIVLALLGEEPFEEISDVKHRIHRPTLKRIVSDLEKIHDSREWMDETRRIVADRFKGIGHGTAPHFPSGLKPKRQNETHLVCRPKMLLRHVGQDNWDVLLDVPSFRAISSLDKGVQLFLEKTRFRLNGGDGLKPGVWLLSSSNRKGILHSWPDEKQPLIIFEQKCSAIDHIMSTECRLDSGPVWLFRIGPDGIAREIRSRTVRPDCNYIVVTAGDLPQQHECMSLCTLNCPNMSSFRITMPSSVSSETITWLNTIGLQVAHTIRVWPAGLPGRGWDGEGSSEWLTTEKPCFGIFHDHPVDAYIFQLDGEPEKQIRTDSIGNSIFVELSPLPVGTYNLKVKALRNREFDDAISSSQVEGFIQLTVREPEPWISGTTDHSSFIVAIDPLDFDLEKFWRNETQISVNGPIGYTAKVTIRLEAFDGKPIFKETFGSLFNLPINPIDWKKRFNEFQNQHKNKTDWKYLEAASGSLTIDCGTLGICSLSFEHRARPVRWLVRYDGKNIAVKLIDDTGQEGISTRISYYNFNRPFEQLSVDYEQALSSGVVVEPPGGLYIAQFSDYSDVVAVSTAPDGGLEQLGIFPTFSNPERSQQNFINVLNLITSWQEARLYGFLIKNRYQKVSDGLLAVLYKMLCGQKWAEAECQLKDQLVPKRMLSQISESSGFRKFADDLYQNISIANENSTQRIDWFRRAARRYLGPTNDNFCNFALRLASLPHTLREYDDDSLNRYFNEIVDNPIILRAARLFVILPSIRAEYASQEQAD